MTEEEITETVRELRTALSSLIIFNSNAKEAGYELLRYRENPEAIEDLANELIQAAEEREETLRILHAKAAVVNSVLSEQAEIRDDSS